MKSLPKIAALSSSLLITTFLTINITVFAQEASPSPSPTPEENVSPTPSPDVSPSPTPEDNSSSTTTSPSPTPTAGEVLGTNVLGATGKELEIAKWLLAAGATILIFLWIVKLSRDAKD